MKKAMKNKKTYISPSIEALYMEPATPLALSDTETKSAASDYHRTSAEGPKTTGPDNEDTPAKQSPFGSSLWSE